MLARPILWTMALAACVAAAAPLAAQSTQVGGTVKLRQADGQVAAVAGAQIDIYRTDIWAEYRTRTGPRGTYVFAGLQYAGTYTIVVSAPGAAPAYRAGVRPGHAPVQDFELQPGDGARLTLAQVRERQGAGNRPPN